MKKSSGQIVRRYGTALFESAVEANAVAEVQTQAQVLLQAFTPESMQFFLNPGVPETAKRDVLESVLTATKAHAVLSGVIKLVLTNNRFMVLPGILQNFSERADRHLGIARVDIVAAQALNADDVKGFESALSGALKKKVILASEVDPTLKAGYVIKIGNTVVDASLRTRLLSLKESLSH